MTCAILLSTLPSSGATLDSETRAWEVLDGLRNELSAGPPLEARFDQSFVPSGFSTGDVESGSLFLDLPRCLRFDYLEPFPKSFLLCGDWIYTWNPGEASGRRYLLEESDADGLDLLRLDVDSLRRRYRARVVSESTQGIGIELTPLEAAGEIRSATLELAPGGRELRALAYRDAGGDQTRFEIGSARDLDDRAAFQPPQLEWLHD